MKNNWKEIFGTENTAIEVLEKFNASSVAGKQLLASLGIREEDKLLLTETIEIAKALGTERAREFLVWVDAEFVQIVNSASTQQPYSTATAKAVADQVSRENLAEEMEDVIDLFEKNAEKPIFDGKESELFELVGDYAHTWQTLYEYDERRISHNELNTQVIYKISYKDAKKVILDLQKDEKIRGKENQLFGIENSDKLEAIFDNINQSFDGVELYPSIEEKAANLLYLIIKDHPFIDGNKRIGSFLFVYFLKHNGYHLEVNALSVLALLVATSEAPDKEVMIKLVVRLIQNNT